MLDGSIELHAGSRDLTYSVRISPGKLKNEAVLGDSAGLLDHVDSPVTESCLNNCGSMIIRRTGRYCQDVVGRSMECRMEVSDRLKHMQLIDSTPHRRGPRSDHTSRVSGPGFSAQGPQVYKWLGSPLKQRLYTNNGKCSLQACRVMSQRSLSCEANNLHLGLLIAFEVDTL